MLHAALDLLEKSGVEILCLLLRTGALDVLTEGFTFPRTYRKLPCGRSALLDLQHFRAHLVTPGAPEKKILDHIVFIGDYDVGTRSAVETEIYSELSPVVIQFPYHGSVERKLTAREDYRALEVLSCILFKALKLLCLCCLCSGREDVKAALWRTDFSVEEKASALSVIELPGHRVERALDHALDLGAVQRGFG